MKWLMAGKVALATSVFFSSSVSAADLWSTDLWSEQTQQDGHRSQNTWTEDGWGSNKPAAPPDLGGGTNTEGTGLWSENLWGTPKTEEQPKPVEGIPSPEGKESTPPANKPKPDADQGQGQGEEQGQPNVNLKPVITMQIGSSQASVRGQYKELPMPPVTINGRAMVPLRFIGESLGAEFDWSAKDMKVTMVLDSKKVELWVDRTTGLVNGKEAPLEFPPVIFNGTTLVPLRFVSEHFGYKVDFDNESQTIVVSEDSGKGTREPSEPLEPPKPPEPPEPAAPEPDQNKPVESNPDESPLDELNPELGFQYFGTWSMHMDGRSKGIPLGAFIIAKDGTYAMNHSIYGKATGTWRVAEIGEIIGFDQAIILEDGLSDTDWALVPKQEGIVSVRYHYGYTGQTKIWFEDSLGIRTED